MIGWAAASWFSCIGQKGWSLMHSVQRRSSCLFFEGFHVHFGQTALLQTFCHPVFFFLVQRQNRFPHQAAGEYTALYQSFLQTGMGFAGSWPPP